MSKPTMSKTPDGVQMAMIASRMQHRPQDAEYAFRTARSGILNTAHDFSCVVLTADCKLPAAAESLPNHIRRAGPDVPGGAEAIRPEARRLLPAPALEGNSHAADHCMIVPVIDDGGTLRFLFAKAHQGDCGNRGHLPILGCKDG